MADCVAAALLVLRHGVFPAPADALRRHVHRGAPVLQGAAPAGAALL